MQIKLLELSARGIICERSSILCDTQGGAELSFITPDNGQYIAIFIDEKGFRYQAEIHAGVVRIPQEILLPQIVQLYVGKVVNGNCSATYVCEPICIHAFDNMIKSKLEITGGATESDIRQRLAEIEQQFCTQMQKFSDAERKLAEQIDKYNIAIMQYNSAITAINSIIERITALEANYDPTVVKQ